MGDVELSRGPGHERARVNMRRLALLRPAGSGLRVAWQGETFAGGNASKLGLSGTSWATGDMDGNGLEELLLFGADSCRVLSFAGESASSRTVAFDGGAVEAAACCDVNADNVTDVATIEYGVADSGRAVRLLRAYQLAGSSLAPHNAYQAGIDWGEDTKVTLLGGTRLEDYPGVLPVVAGIRADVRPSVYSILYEPGPDSLVLTTNPFPWQEWFSKTRVLPAGELSLFNVGDTLIAYGYFVPGARRSGPSQSFAALQDGEWRLLPLTAEAARLSGPVCRFTKAGTAGWLELRDGLFYFYPGDIFRWQP